MAAGRSVLCMVAVCSFCMMFDCTAALGDVIYVDASTLPGGDGQSWGTAFNDLQDALSEADPCDDVWVAEGTYRPSRQGDPNDARSTTFELVSGVAVYGGFPTGGGTWLDRDPSLYETILSGDIGIIGDDSDNSYHVVTGSSADATAVLDGFVITGGNADGPVERGHKDGGGMYNDGGKPTLRGCVFIGNNAERDGGGMWNTCRDATLSNCRFEQNTADRDGGGMWNKSRSLVMSDCTFIGNGADRDGGGMRNESSRLTVTDCSFTANSAGQDGGGMWNKSSRLTVSGCEFNRNSAQRNGGGMWNEGSNMTATDCMFNRNSAGNSGGGMWNVGSDLATINCTFTRNIAQTSSGGLFCRDSETIIVDCVFSENSPDAIWIDNEIARIVGIVRAVSNDLAGNGTLYIEREATLALDNCFVLCNLSGPGTVEVEADSELVIQGDAVIDLGNPDDPNANGRIQGGTLLSIKDTVQISNATINISRASIEGSAIISQSVIIIDSNAPYGQFYMDPNVSLSYVDIHVDGDRYMEMNPSAFDGVFEHVRIFVTIRNEGDQGGLFELRGKNDLVGHSCEPNEFVCYVDPCTIPDCNLDTWSIEWMKLMPGAKLNLTNRFPFQPPYDLGSDDDVLYVKKLILGEDSVLNTTYNRVYCEDVQAEPNAVVTNVPLLGFSLINIAFDDEVEFLVRVTHNNFEHPDDPNLSRFHVTRFEGNEPDLNGMMEMVNMIDLDANSSTSGQMVNAQAKGLFAKASEDTVLVMFEYMFVDDPCGDAELVVSLSDTSEIGESVVEIARLKPPAPGRAGSVGSGELAVFSGIFPRGSLDFTRGTYVGLELKGTNSRCWINNWDPQVNCIAICGDYYVDMFNLVNVYDYLVLLAEMGLSSPGGVGKGCLDIVSDGCVNVDDLQAWGIDEVLNKCPMGSSDLSFDYEARLPGGPVMANDIGDAEPLYILGKPASGVGASVPASYLYNVDANGTTLGGATSPACPGGSCDDSSGSFVADGDGRLYQVSGELGLIRQGTSEVVVEPNIIYDGQNLISVGFNDGYGLLLSDAAFDPYDPNLVYVVPVEVDPDDGNCPYMAAAKLQLTGTGSYDLLELYGKNPATDPNQMNEPNNCDGDIVYEPDVQHLNEIEIDSHGNLFVLSSHTSNDNAWILIYEEGLGNASEVRVSLSDANIVGATSMAVSGPSHKVYVTSSVQDASGSAEDLIAEAFCFSMERTGYSVDGLTYEGRVDINCPEPEFCSSHPSLCNPSEGYLATVIDMVSDPQNGTVYVTGLTAPKFPVDDPLPSGVNEIFTTPVFAVISPDSNDPVEATLISGGDLALPLGMVWAGALPGRCSGADFQPDGSVDRVDLSVMAYYWLESNCPEASDCGGGDLEPIGEPDGDVDLRDFAVFASHWLEAQCL